MIGGRGAEERFLLDPMPVFSRPPKPTTIALAERIAEARLHDARWWAAWNARIDGHIAGRAAAEREIDATIAKMETGWAEDRAFQERWNAMSYAEALAFQRARGL